MEVPLPRHPSRAGRRGFTLTEPLVVAAIVAVLASLTFVSIARGRATAVMWSAASGNCSCAIQSQNMASRELAIVVPVVTEEALTPFRPRIETHSKQNSSRASNQN